MSQYTENYHLEKPESNDDFENFLDNYGSNMDIIDEHLGQGGGGSSVSWQQLQVTGDKIATIRVSGIPQDVFAPNSQTFSMAISRANINSDEKYSTIFGKIKKWFADLKAVAFSGSYNDLSNTPTKVSDFTNDSGFITSTVNNLANYYLKSETYTQAQVDALIGAISTISIEVVQSLPTQDIKTNTIYLVPKQTAGTQNVYDEYIYVNNAWELIGDTEIDLSNYVTTTDLATALQDYVTSTGLSTILANYYTSSQVDTLLGGKVNDVEVNGTSVVNGQGVAVVTVPTKTSDLNNDSGYLTDSDVSVTQVVSSGTKIATIDVNGTSTDLYAPAGGGGSVNDVTVNGTSVVNAQGVAEVTAVQDNPTFTEAQTRANIASGESFATILGKIKKFFTDLKAVAFSGSYNDLSDKPTIPTNNNQLTNGAGYITSSGSCASATTASKLGSSTVGGDSRGIYLNSGTPTALTFYPAYAWADGQNTANYPWHKFATCQTGTGNYVDIDAIIFIRQRFNGGNFGIIKASVRTNSSGSAMSMSVNWIIRKGYPVDSVIISPNSGTTGTNTTFNLYLGCGTYPRTIIVMLAGSTRGWELVNSAEAPNTTASDPRDSYNVYASVSNYSSAGDVGHVASATSADSATKTTQDADGYDIRQKYVNVYNSSDIGSSSSVTVNDMAKAGFCLGMIHALTDNPVGSAKWVHVISMPWQKGTNTSWVSQIALGVESGDGLWYRTSSATVVGRAWKRVIDSNNIGSQSVNNATKFNGLSANFVATNDKTKISVTISRTSFAGNSGFLKVMGDGNGSGIDFLIPVHSGSVGTPVGHWVVAPSPQAGYTSTEVSVQINVTQWNFLYVITGFEVLRITPL